MTSPAAEPNEEARVHLAWLMWCFQEGYTNAEDRAIMSNWMRDDPAHLTQHDRVLREQLLTMADEILALLADHRGQS